MQNVKPQLIGHKALEDLRLVLRWCLGKGDFEIWTSYGLGVKLRFQVVGLEDSRC